MPQIAGLPWPDLNGAVARRSHQFRGFLTIPRGTRQIEVVRDLAGGRPDLVVEIVSPSSQRYDRVKKLRWYAELGVPEYWLIDPTARTVERLVLRDREYVIAQSLADDETFAPESFNGLSLSVAELWANPPGR